MDIKKFVRSVPDFPKPGIMFRDITPLLASPQAFQHTIDLFVVRSKIHKIDAVLAAEARGFIFAAPIALALGARFIPVRKPGKLPFTTHAFEYELEYGSDRLELHIDALNPGDRVLLIDDLLATGGTIAACKALAEKCGAVVVQCGFLIELTFLPGRKKLEPSEVFSLIQYADENP